jgi:single-strand DNA-binding protein
MNSVNLLGRLARDPELKFIPTTGMAVTKFILAVDRELSKDKKQEAVNQGKQTADFISITVFGKQAENCANFLVKGGQCAISGRISSGSYTTQTGEKRYTTEILADRIEFLGGNKKNEFQSNGVHPDTTFFDNLPEDNFIPVNGEDVPF